MRDLLAQVVQPQSKDTVVFIYGLVDPRNTAIRYVGKSIKPRQRYSTHLQPSQLKNDNRKNIWIRELLCLALKPELVMLDTIFDSDWATEERKWIARFRSIPGYPRLTNIADGGQGHHGIVSEEERLRRSQARIGVPMPPGTGKKISDANRGKPKSTETKISFSKGQTNRWKESSEEQRQAMLKNLRTPWTDEKRIHRSNYAMNACRSSTATSRYQGVVRINREKPWRAGCTLNRTFKYIGIFATEEEAARARDRFVLAHIGERAPLNFPRSDYTEVAIPICPPDTQE